MKPSDSSLPPDPDNPTNLLHARLRRTTPEFEARFDNLRCQLAQEPRRVRWSGWFASWFSVGRASWAGAMLAVGLVALVAYRSTLRVSLTTTEIAKYGELLALDETLSAAVPLTDPETREAVLELPVASHS